MAGPLRLEHLTSGSVPDLGPETVDRIANVNRYLQQRWTSYFGGKLSHLKHSQPKKPLVSDGDYEQSNVRYIYNQELEVIKNDAEFLARYHDFLCRHIKNNSEMCEYRHAFTIDLNFHLNNLKY